MARKNNEGGHDLTTHTLLSIHEPPQVLVAFRQELVEHPDILDAISDAKTFEDQLGIVGTKLDIALDGMYDPLALLDVLTKAMRNRRFYGNSPHLRAEGLIDVELIEKEDSVELVERDRNVKTLVPETAVVSEVDTTGKKKGIIE